MKPPSKRVVRDAIRILGYAVQHSTTCTEAQNEMERIGEAFSPGAWSLAVKAVYEISGAERNCEEPNQSLRAAAENLLREGWLP